jgi:hypothetical protein
VTSVEFPCALCDAVAMRLTPTEVGDRMLPPGGGGVNVDLVASSTGGVRLEAFGLIGSWRAMTDRRGGPDAIRAAIAAADAAALMQIDPELVPLYCPPCGVVYCVRHWRTWPVFDDDDPSWFDEQRGTCPKGHERRMFD